MPCITKLRNRPFLKINGDLHLESPPTSINRISVLASNDLYAVCSDHLIAFHLEGRLLDDKCPNIITKTICVQVTLRKPFRVCISHLSNNTYLEICLCFDLLNHSIG